MSSENESKKNSGSTFNFKENTINNSAFGDNSKVINNQFLGSKELEEFSLKLNELQKEIVRLSSNLSKEDVSKLENEIAIVESQIQKPKENTFQVVLASLEEIGKIIGKFSAAGIVLKQLFDIAKVLFVGS